jgi:hypothetical protein
MSNTRRRAATITATLATAAREIRAAVRAADPAQAPGLERLRDTGWQLTQLTGELTDMIALLAEHTAHHTERVRQADGDPATEHLARACRELATLRRGLDTAHTAVRNYYTAISQLSPVHAPDLPRRSP